MATNNKNDAREGAKAAGFALAAAAAAAAGVYFLYGKNGAQNRKKVKGWMLKAKGEVLEKLENLKEVNEETYHKVVDTVATRYGALKNVDKIELAQMIKELKGHWTKIKGQLKEGKQKTKAKRAAKPVARRGRTKTSTPETKEE